MDSGVDAQGPAGGASDQVVARWQDEEFTAVLAQVHWMAPETVRGHLNRRATGRRDVDWLTAFLGRYASEQHRRALVLGCGEGWLERAIAPRWWLERIDAVDVAAGAVERARAEAARLGLAKIHYAVVDLDRDGVPPGPFDLIIAHSVLHHLERLEFVYDGLARALAPNGLLLVSEYVGPNRFQFAERQLAAIDALLGGLPARLRRGRFYSGEYPNKPRPDLAQLIAEDPSEAVRSAEVMPLLRERFVTLEEHPAGGTLLQHLLFDLAQNFDEAEPIDRALLELLCLTEELLVARGAIASDYVVAAFAHRWLPRKADALDAASPFADRGPVSTGRATPVPARALARLLRRPVTAPFGSQVSALAAAQNELLFGDWRRDWIESALGPADLRPLHCLAAGRGAAALKRRLEGSPRCAAVEAARRLRERRQATPVDRLLLAGVCAEASDLRALAQAAALRVADAGEVVALERVSGEEAFAPWVARFADEIAAALPPGLLRPVSPLSSLRRWRTLAGGAGPTPARLRAAFTERFAEVELIPVSSALGELLHPRLDPRRAGALPGAGDLFRLLAAIERLLLAEETLPPSMVLLRARRPLRRP